MLVLHSQLEAKSVAVHSVRVLQRTSDAGLLLCLLGPLQRAPRGWRARWLGIFVEGRAQQLWRHSTLVCWLHPAGTRRQDISGRHRCAGLLAHAPHRTSGRARVSFFLPGPLWHAHVCRHLLRILPVPHTLVRVHPAAPAACPGASSRLNRVAHRGLSLPKFCSPDFGRSRTFLGQGHCIIGHAGIPSHCTDQRVSICAGMPYQKFPWFSSSAFNSAGFRSSFLLSPRPDFNLKVQSQPEELDPHASQAHAHCPS